MAESSSSPIESSAVAGDSSKAAGEAVGAGKAGVQNKAGKAGKHSKATKATKAGKPRSRVVRGIICAAAGGVCWGFSGTCAQLLIGQNAVPVAWVTSVRLVSAAILFLVIAMVKNRSSLRAVMRDWRSLGAIAGFALFGVLMTQASYLSAIGYTNAGTGTMMERLGLLVILAYVCIITPRFPHKRELLGLIMAMAGVFLLATQGDPTHFSMPWQGLAWGLVSAVAFACYSLMPVRVLAKWGSVIVTGLAMAFGGILSCAVVQPWNMGIEVTPTIFWVMVAMVLVGTFGAYTLFLQGVNDAGPVRASLVGSVEPVSATVISAVWLGTSVSMYDIFGCALIVGMVFLVAEREEDSGQMLPLFQGRASALGYYKSRRARDLDDDALWALLDDGHRAMRALGIQEALKRYPSMSRLHRSISHGSTYLVENEDGKPIGMFAVALNGDPHYTGKNAIGWLTTDDEKPAEIESDEQRAIGKAHYAALHWVTVAEEYRRMGVGSFMLGEAERIARAAGKKSIRADIYRENDPMRALLEYYGYKSCGKIEFKNTFGQIITRSVYEKRIV